MKRAGKRVCLVGAGVAGRRGGDPWVARVLFPRRFMPAIMGDASVPTPHRTSPAPTSAKLLLNNLPLKAVGRQISDVTEKTVLVP